VQVEFVFAALAKGLARWGAAVFGQESVARHVGWHSPILDALDSVFATAKELRIMKESR
jgi:hypothetical protein